MLPKYKVLTRKSLLNMEYVNEKQWEEDCLKLFNEQNSILKENGIDYDYVKSYIIHFFNKHTTELTIDEAIQCLIIKDGYDLVQYENGNLGYIAYYNGADNGFEILV